MTVHGSRAKKPSYIKREGDVHSTGVSPGGPTGFGCMVVNGVVVSHSIAVCTLGDFGISDKVGFNDTCLNKTWDFLAAFQDFNYEAISTLFALKCLSVGYLSVPVRFFVSLSPITTSSSEKELMTRMKPLVGLISCLRPPLYISHVRWT